MTLWNCHIVMWSCRSSGMLIRIMIFPCFIICLPWRLMVILGFVLSVMHGMRYISCFLGLQSYKYLSLNCIPIVSGVVMHLKISWRSHWMSLNVCHHSHLTTCHYKTLLGKDFEMEIVRKILKAARVFKTMNITVESHLSSKAKLRICQKLMKFRRSSKTCQITFE